MKRSVLHLEWCENFGEIPAGGNACVALGYFDGVHIGHRAVLARAVAAARANGARAAVFTFTPPADRPVKGSAILTPTEKRRRLAALGFDVCVCPPFASFCALTPEEFVRGMLMERLRAAALFCGENFTFGRDRRGDVAWLRRFCASQPLTVEAVPLTQWAGAPVSSTRIRAALTDGDIPAVNAMLGEPYAIDLPVRHGRHLGTALGFPTINQVYPDGMLLPREGVYATQVLLDGAWLPGATGLGTRPTVSGEGVTCETFIPDFTGELYGDSVRVRFCKFLWPTRKYDSLDALAQMVRRAADASRALCAPDGNFAENRAGNLTNPAKGSII